MIKKIVCGFLFGFLVLALVLYVNFGVRYPFSFGEDFRSVLASSMEEFSRIKLPTLAIPKIPIMPDTSDFLTAVFNIANFLSSIVNVFLSLINALIQIIAFLVCIIHSVERFGGLVQPVTTPVV